MSEIDDKINQLEDRLENMLKYQEYFQREMSQIRYEINVLRAVQQKRTAQAQQQPPQKPPVREFVPPLGAPQTESQQQANQQRQEQANPQTEQQTYQKSKAPNFGYPASSAASYYQTQSAQAKSNLEKFIGENLISKIGIVILVLGVAIGAKYAIDRNLISPLMRIILGYIVGFGLLGFAVKLKPKYHNFSAVLLSGAMAIMYFITYFAYSLYELFGQSSAFALMLIFTVFTVAAAINYSRQVIAHIGLVGAYAIPFLLSEDSGRIAILLSYVAIINVGILAVSVKKYWKPLFYSSFIFTWAIFYGWYFTAYKPAAYFNLALFFLTVFFLTFYLTFIAYKLVSKENIAIENLVLILANSFIFYGLGYVILYRDYEQYLGLFTVANAGIHFIFAFVASRLRSVAQDLIFLLAGLVLTFATIAVPVQLDGNWVTLIWTAEAVILFWIGRTKSISLYENYSYPLMFLAIVSLLQDWKEVGDRSMIQIMPGQFPIFNVNFVTSLLFVAAFAFIYFLNRSKKYSSSIGEELYEISRYVFPVIFLCALYNTFRIEIANYFHYQTVVQAANLTPYGEAPIINRDLSSFNIVWQINYTMLFFTLLSFINLSKIKDSVLGIVTFGLSALALIVFITVGLYFISELRESYLLQTNAQYFDRGIFHILIRYISYVFVTGLLISIYQSIKRENASGGNYTFVFDFVFHVSLLFIASSELLNLMDIFGYKDSYKLGLSILWGIYALVLVILGIIQLKKYLRVGAIVLFGVTLAKLFLYDISNLTTIAKTIVFVSLGILLLIVSFLYNKYKHLIFESNDPPETE